MKQYEITFIVDPVLSGDEIKATAKTYIDLLEKNGAKIVHVDEMGLRQLAYPIGKRTTGVYYCVEFQVPNGEIINPTELAFRRDERIIRFLSFKLDKYGIKYNEDKRNGLIGKVKKKEKRKDNKDRDRRGSRSKQGPKSTAPKTPAPKPAAPVAAAPAPAPAPKPEAKEEEE